MKQILPIILLILINTTPLFSQQLLNIVNSPLDTIPCNLNCEYIHANYIQPKKTTSYIVTTIPFNPSSISGTSLTLPDDKFSAAVPIGFTFCFYGNSYTDIYISANGHLSFNANYSNGTCSFDTKKPMPFYNSTYPDDAIFCPFNDGNGGTIKYFTTGTAPFRKFIVSYISIPYFGNIGTPSTFQCILNETTNDIECHITNKTTINNDTANHMNYSTLGIQSIGANNFLTAPNKNASMWSATNESWKFSPNGGNGYTIKWYEGNQLLGTNVDSINICAPFPRTIIAKLQLECPNILLTDTIKIVKISPKFDSIILTKTLCKNIPSGMIKVYGNGNNPPFLYSLDGGAYTSNNLFTPLGFGIHFITIKDANGCTKDTMVNILATSDLAAHIDSFKNPTCPLQNGKIWGSYTGGTAPYTYYWSTGATTNPITGLGQGTYYFVVIDANGCKDSIGITLVYDSLPNVTEIIIRPVCLDSSGSINLTPFIGTQPFTYLWNNGATTEDLYNIPSGNYSVLITDAGGCTKVRNYILTDTLNMFLNMNTIIQTTCGLNNGSAHVTALSGQAPISYAWSSGAITATANNLAPGWQTVTVTDANGCTRHDSVNIQSSTQLVIQFLPANSHCDSANGLINTLVTNNTGPVTYLWSTGATTSIINQLWPGYYSLTVHDSIGCVITDTVQLFDDGVPHLHVVQYLAPQCHGDSTGKLVLDGISGVAPYKFSFDGSTFSSTAVLTNFAAGTYTIFIRDANSCITDTIITFPEPVEILITYNLPDTLVCYADTTAKINVSATLGKPPYLWNINGQGWQTGTSFSNLGIGTYTIQVRDSLNCKSQIIVPIIGPFLPLQVNMVKTDVPCYQESTGTLNAQITGGWTPYQLTWAHTTSQLTFLDKLADGKYQITIIDEKGCKIIGTETLLQNYCCDTYLPNSFTPNGDNINDIYRAISPASDIEEFLFKIYNRWGQLVFTSDNVKDGWNGKIYGTDANIDTYYYMLRYRCKHSQETFLLKGDVTLLR